MVQNFIDLNSSSDNLLVDDLWVADLRVVVFAIFRYSGVRFHIFHCVAVFKFSVEHVVDQMLEIW